MDLKAEHPALNLNEIARICFVNGYTVRSPVKPVMLQQALFAYTDAF